ncbi:MAG: ABC transporter substrate-binding protein [Deltaproteobacteria bacterium]|nr:ABC transporter substrate-binding protein [Deltaproteobacteria bacterium]
MIYRSYYLSVTLFLVLFVAPSSEAAKIRLAIPGYNITQIAFFTARDRGYYKDEGLDVELIQMTGTLANLALMSGEVPFTSVPAAAMNANLRGANLRVLFSTWERPLFWLMTRTPVRDIRELKNKKMGVPGLNSVGYFLLREFLSKHGLEPGRDYTLIQAGDSAPRLLALQNGFVDATILPLPWNISAQDAGMHEAASIAKSDIIAPNGSIVVREELLKSDPLLIEQFSRATLKGLRFAIDRRAATIPILMRSLRIKEDLAAKAYDAARPALTQDGTFNDDSQRKAVEAVLRAAGAKESLTPDKFFNFTITKKVAADLQTKGWRP